MRIVKDPFIDDIEMIVPLHDKRILEIGCGKGTRSVKIAERCKRLVAIEPTGALIARAARTNTQPNLSYVRASAVSLPFHDHLSFEGPSFDMVLFTLSLHHVPLGFMKQAVDEAAETVSPHGFIIFFEPTSEGSFYEAEIMFDACDGDEREAKRLAYQTIQTCELVPIGEIFSETVFQFDSANDFSTSLYSKKNPEKLPAFLQKHHYELRAPRRINIFRVPVPETTFVPFDASK